MYTCGKVTSQGERVPLIAWVGWSEPYLVTATLQAVIMGLFAVVWTVSKSLDAVICGRAPKEAMRERLVALFVPLKVSNHLLLLHEDPRIARQRVTVKVLPVIEFFAQSVAALDRVAVTVSTQLD